MHLTFELEDDLTALTIRRKGGAWLTVDVLRAIEAIEGVRFASHMHSGNIVMVVWPSLKPSKDGNAIRAVIRTIHRTVTDMDHQVYTTRHIPDMDMWLA